MHSVNPASQYNWEAVVDSQQLADPVVGFVGIEFERSVDGNPDVVVLGKSRQSDPIRIPVALNAVYWPVSAFGLGFADENSSVLSHSDCHVTYSIVNYHFIKLVFRLPTADPIAHTIIGSIPSNLAMWNVSPV